MKKIISKKNPEIKFLKRLIENGGVLDDFFLVEGKKLLDEVIKSNHQIIKIYSVQENLKYDIDTILIDKNIAKHVSRFPSPSNTFALCRKEIDNVSHSFPAILLDGVQNPENLGGISRSAEAFNFNTIFLTKGSVNPFKSHVIRSSMGSSLRINFIKIDGIDYFLKELESMNTKIYVAEKHGKYNLYELNPTKNSLIIFGNEGHGISENLRKLGEKIFIPINKKVDSLNLLSSASIIMSYFYSNLI